VTANYGVSGDPYGIAVVMPHPAAPCPCTVFPSTAVPGTVDSADGAVVELGVKIRTTRPGSITGVRFYKAAANTGTHTG
jgi:hypothetical protein